MSNITKQYLIEQINRVEHIIKEAEDNIKLNDYCTKKQISDLKNLKNTVNYKIYKEDVNKYDIYDIKYKYFKNSYNYKTFGKDVLLNYLEDIISKAYELELLDMTFTY